uniref:BPTI/Kunitz inhibitor domain-containing protein n=1 Tax=Laticauda laticaudata TaxID=8630 RepID=A0A8C5RKA0_LATLA
MQHWFSLSPEEVLPIWGQEAVCGGCGRYISFLSLLSPPQQRVEVFPFIPCKNTCNNDHDCRLTEKCCFTGCSRGLRSDRCRLPRDQGSCSKELQHFYYDPEEKKCISFVYHGCEGNSNNFETRELCEKTCGKISKGTEDDWGGCGSE